MKSSTKMKQLKNMEKDGDNNTLEQEEEPTHLALLQTEQSATASYDSNSESKSESEDNLGWQSTMVYLFFDVCENDEKCVRFGFVTNHIRGLHVNMLSPSMSL